MDARLETIIDKLQRHTLRLAEDEGVPDGRNPLAACRQLELDVASELAQRIKERCTSLEDALAEAVDVAMHGMKPLDLPPVDQRTKLSVIVETASDEELESMPFDIDALYASCVHHVSRSIGRDVQGMVERAMRVR